jgi:hypothetical protein
MTWSYPQLSRQKVLEIQMKDTLLRTLRTNNRHVLDMKNARASVDTHTPLTMPDSVVDEACGPDADELNTHMGTYRRYYAALLPAQHKQTAPVHEPYWSLSACAPLRPQPHKYLYGRNRSGQELSHTFLIALNMIVLKLDETKKVYFV